MLVSGQALPPAPSQLTAVPGTGLGDFFPCLCSQNNQQGWLNQVEGPLFPCSLACGTKGRNFVRLPAQGHGWRSLWRSIPSTNGAMQIVFTRSQVLNTPAKSCSLVSLKRKTHIPVFTATTTSTAVSRTGLFLVMTDRKSK